MDRFKVGMAAFLLSETFFFIMMLLTFTWYQGEAKKDVLEYLSFPSALALTGVFVASSVTVGLAVFAHRRGSQWGVRLLLAATFLLGAAFLGTEAYEWTRLLSEEISPASGLFGSNFYLLTGFHGLHVIAGLVMLLAFIGMSATGRLGARRGTALQVGSWFWHFNTAVWIGILSVVYLWAFV